jgi:type III restriction enzyme
MLPVQSQFSLADIIGEDAFFKLGQRIAADPDNQLLRTTISARVIEGHDGVRRTELVTAPAVDKVISAARLFPLEDLREQLLEQLLASPVVPARANQRAAAAPLVQKFFDGLGSKAQELLSTYLDRAAAGLIKLVTEKQRQFASKPTYNEVVEVIEFRPMRHGKPETSSDRASAFKKGRAYEGYKRSLYTQDWFDSSTERTLANMLDVEDGISYWVRLQTGDLPILWATGREYNPDFIAVEDSGRHWVVEVKMDKEMTSVDVKGKREAARRWANHVTADAAVDATWRYLLASEADIATAKGSWASLKKLTA